MTTTVSRQREWQKAHPNEGICERCGQIYQRRDSRQHYCDPCRPEVLRESCRRCRRKQKDPAASYHAPIGDSLVWQVTCLWCGASFQVSDARVKYCDSCRPLVQREQSRIAARRKRQNKKARLGKSPQ